MLTCTPDRFSRRAKPPPHGRDERAIKRSIKLSRCSGPGLSLVALPCNFLSHQQRAATGRLREEACGARALALSHTHTLTHTSRGGEGLQRLGVLLGGGESVSEPQPQGTSSIHPASSCRFPLFPSSPPPGTPTCLWRSLRGRLQPVASPFPRCRAAPDGLATEKTARSLTLSEKHPASPRPRTPTAEGFTLSGGARGLAARRERKCSSTQTEPKVISAAPRPA